MKPMRADASLGTSADRAPALIQARGLSKTYVTGSGEVTALKSLDFEIYDGEFVSVVGQTAVAESQPCSRCWPGSPRPRITEGRPHFFRDLYGRDPRVLAGLEQEFSFRSRPVIDTKVVAGP